MHAARINLRKKGGLRLLPALFAVALFAILIGAAYVNAVAYPAAVPQAPVPADGQLLFMTFNMRHALGDDGVVDLDRVSLLLKKSQADIIALQEVDRYWARSGRRDQVKELAGQLGMYWSFSASLRQGKRQYGNAILSKYPIEQNVTVPLPGNQERRSLLETRIRIGPAVLRVVTTHLGVGAGDRVKQFELLRQRLADTDEPTVVLGDWNTGVEDPEIRRLDTNWMPLQLPEGTATLRSGQAIDHIFANLPVKSESAHVWPETTSDHFPVLGRLRVPGL